MKTISYPFEFTTDGGLTVKNDVEGLEQKIVTRLNIFLSEWFLEIEGGVPYFETDGNNIAIFSKPIDRGTAAAIINKEIFKEKEVTNIKDVSASLDPQTRVFSYSSRIETIHGDINIEI